MVRESADRNDVAYAERVEQQLISGDECNSACSLECAELCERSSAEQNRAVPGGMQSCNRAQQRRLSDAVWAEQRDELTGSDACIDVRQPRTPGDGNRYVAKLDHPPLRFAAVAGRR